MDELLLGLTRLANSGHDSTHRPASDLHADVAFGLDLVALPTNGAIPATAELPCSTT
ncbi:hypothetical protein ACFVX6_17350 [Streptomyces sp. NPDC058289]|uniref:hypothetical protein n=1 Tax=Streptomyces sp. NPDC058289 TaxID=3346425 RepID=UPI0036EF114D